MGAVAAVQTAMPLANVSTFRARGALRDVSRSAALCSTCKQRELCLSIGLDAGAMAELEHDVVTARTRLAKGAKLFGAGDRFTALYAIRFGSFKTVMLAANGHEQLAGYHMPGEILGTDGIGVGLHGADAIALEDSEVCTLPFERIEKLARDHAPVQHNLHRILSREIDRERKVMLMLGTMNAEQRLATFLFDLSQRNRALGYSSCEFVLRMTREEIGGYLGLKLETISRLLSRFQREGLVQVQGRVVKLLDHITLRRRMQSA